MIKELHKKFLFIFMFFVTILLLIIQGTFFFITSNQTYYTNDKILNQALGQGNPLDETILNNYNLLKVEINQPLGSIQILSNEWNQEESEILKMIQEVIGSGSTSGIMPGYNVQYAIRETPYTRTIAFIDLTVSNSIQATITLRTLVVNIITWWIALVMALYLSKKVVDPVKKSMTQQQQLVSNLSHELRNPLAIISSNTDILASSTTPEQAKWLGYIRDETKRMNELVSSMLYLSQSDEKMSEVPLTPLNLSELTLGVVLPLEAIAYEQKKELQIEVEPDIVINGNSNLLKQLVSILTDNAFKYSEDNGTITIRLFVKAHMITLEVSNTGDTIDSEHLFDRFYRGDEARSGHDRGYGLGLSIAKVITQQNHGTITVKSENRITTFTVTFKKRKH